jgi:hypothetical protein
MRYTTAILLLACVALLGGCASHPAYYTAPPPVAYAPGPPPVIQVGQQNGFADGVRIGERDRVGGRGYRPASGERFANTPGYSPTLGGPFRQYQSAYRDAYKRGYRQGYARG